MPESSRVLAIRASYIDRLGTRVMLRTGRRKRRLLFRLMLLCLGGVVLAAGAGWIGLRHIPAWYHPVLVADDDYQRVRDSLTDTYRQISDSIVAGSVFEMTVTDQMVSEWCVARGQIWPDAEEWLPPWLLDPVVAFVEDRVVLSARFDRDGWQAIIGAHFSIEVLGEIVSLRLERVTAGAIPIPLPSLASPLEKLVHSDRLDPDTMPDELGRALRKLRTGPALNFLVRGQHIPNSLVWKNGNRPYSVRSVRIGDGWIKAKIEPL